jgi:hypothetical protein
MTYLEIAHGRQSRPDPGEVPFPTPKIALLDAEHKHGPTSYHGSTLKIVELPGNARDDTLTSSRDQA